MIIKYYRKNVYGNELMYVADPAEALTLELLLSHKTILRTDIALFKSLGIEFEEVLAPKNPLNE